MESLTVPLIIIAVIAIIIGMQTCSNGYGNNGIIKIGEAVKTGKNAPFKTAQKGDIFNFGSYHQTAGGASL